MSVTKIQYKGKEITYNDCRLLAPVEIVANINKVAEMAEATPGGLRVLTDMRNVPINFHIFEEIKVIGDEVFRHTVNTSAILGIMGIKRILLEIYLKFSDDKIIPFTTMEEAMDFLVEDE